MKSKYSGEEEKFQIVMESFADNVIQAEMCQRHGIYPAQLNNWKERFIQAESQHWSREVIQTPETERSGI